MNVYKEVWIHPGDSHRDEFLALGILLHAGAMSKETKIVRGDPPQDKIEDPAVAIIDVGGVYDAARGCFDHHCLPRLMVECAMTLVAQNFTIPGTQQTYADLLGEKPWYQFTAWIDSQGPSRAAAQFGLEELPGFMRSPIEAAALEAIKEEDWNTVLPLAKATVNLKVQHALKLQEQMKFLREQAYGLELAGINVLVVPADDTFGSEAFRKEEEARGVTYDACLSWDNRGKGWSLYRYDDSPKLDLSRLEGDVRVGFTHKGGFIAKTIERLDFEALTDLFTIAAL